MKILDNLILSLSTYQKSVMCHQVMRSLICSTSLVLMSGYTRERSSIIVIGINVHTAPVELREKFSIPEAQWPQAIRELCALNHIEEAAVLSTCNRIEIYVEALSQHRGVREVTEWMSKVCTVSFILHILWLFREILCSESFN